MLIIPLAALPSQVVTVQLANQNCRMAVYQKTTGLFLDLYVNDVLIIGGVICLDRNRIVIDAYLGFIGDLRFYDSQGRSNPTYDGLGARYLLVYLEVGDV